MKKIFTLFAALAMVMSMSAKVVYLKLNDNWASAEANYHVHVWGGDSDNTSIKMEKVSGASNMYQIEVGTHTSIIFLRHYPGYAVTESNKWETGNEKLWNRMGNLTIPADKNCFTINNGEWSIETEDASAHGVWSTYEPVKPVYKDITYTVQCAGFTGTPKIKWWGADGLADAEEAQEMTKGNYNRYSYTFTQIDSIAGVSFYIELDGFQSKTIKIHESNNVTYFYTILQDVVVKGEFDEWGEGILLETRSDDYTTVSGVVQLDAEKTYQFKLIVNDNWKGVNEDVTVTKDAPTTTIGTGDLNAKIKSELKGGYTFTYNYLTQEVTVAYPYVGTLDLGELAPYYGFDGVQLADDNYNEITIYNLQDEAYQYGEEFEAQASIKHNGEWLTLTGKASWTLADGVMTMVATNMVDENNTVSYTITATALAPQEYTIVCNGTYEEEVTEYYSSAKYTATTEDEDVIVIEIGTFGSGEEAETSVSGQFNDNWFASVEYTIAEGEDGVKVLNATAIDEVGNTYIITMTATKAVYPEINIYNATVVSMEEGSLRLSASYEGKAVSFELYQNWMGELNAMLEIGVWEEEGYMSCMTDTPALEEEDGDYTVTGIFVDDFDNKYIITITTKANPATGLDNVTSTVAPVKVIENNQLIIIKNGVRYNVMGATVK